MADLVDVVIKAWSRSSFQYGKTDCMTSLADYARICGYPDAAVDFRGTYSTEEEADDLMLRNGNFLFMFEKIGMTPVSSPERGDVVIALMPNGLTAGLHTGHSVAMRMPRGCAQLNVPFARIKRAWRP